MSHKSHDEESSLFSRRQFLDVVSKSVIATAAFCILPMSEGAANAHPGPKKGGAGVKHGYNPYGTYCEHNPVNPYNAYKPYGGCDHDPKNPYHAYNPYHCYKPYTGGINPVNPYSTYNPYA